jgi:hypothetical protein
MIISLRGNLSFSSPKSTDRDSKIHQLAGEGLWQKIAKLTPPPHEREALKIYC